METKKKRATTFDEQLDILEERGVRVADRGKAKEILADIGYYRLGFYFFPFENTFPYTDGCRRHAMKDGTEFGHAVALYYYDFDLRNILNKYLSRIEVALRTTMVYRLSNKYRDNPAWFADDSVVTAKFVGEFKAGEYKRIAREEVIRRHKEKHPNDEYAPAWKTMEFMTFGSLVELYRSLTDVDDQKMISLRFQIVKTTIFANYIETVRRLRNACAHGKVLYDLHLDIAVRHGPAGRFDDFQSTRLVGVLAVVRYLLRTVSANRLYDMNKELEEATLRLYGKCPQIRPVIEQRTNILV